MFESDWRRFLLRQILLTALISVFVLACGDSSDEAGLPFVAEPDMAITSDFSTDIEPSDSSMISATAAARFKLLDPVTGRGVNGVTVSVGTQESVTDSQGEAEVVLPEGPYAVRLFKTGVRVHTIYGVSAGVAFEQASYFSSERITGLVFGSLGIADDPDAGIVVVGLDLPSLAPAVGASASLDLASDPPFVLGPAGAAPGSTIAQGQLGFVSFPNTEVGTATVSVNYPQGGCAVFPSESGAPELVVAAGEVSIVAYTCR